MFSYFDFYFFKNLFCYNYSALVSYNSSLQARRCLLNLWNRFFVDYKMDENSIIDDLLLFKIIDYNNQFLFNNQNNNLNNNLLKNLNDIKYKYYHEDYPIVSRNKLKDLFYNEKTKIIKNNLKKRILKNKNFKILNTEENKEFNYLIEENTKSPKITKIMLINIFKIINEEKIKKLFKENIYSKIYLKLNLFKNSFNDNKSIYINKKSCHLKLIELSNKIIRNKYLWEYYVYAMDQLKNYLFNINDRLTEKSKKILNKQLKHILYLLVIQFNETYSDNELKNFIYDIIDSKTSNFIASI